MPRTYSISSKAACQVDAGLPAFQVLYPPEARRLLRCKMINAEEYILLGVIHGYATIRDKRTNEKRGCYASVDNLAVDCASSRRATYRNLKTLKRLRLVIEKTDMPMIGGRLKSAMEVDWSHVPTKDELRKVGRWC